MKNRSDGQSIEKEYLIDGCCESENLMKARMRSGVDYEHDEEQLLLHSSTSYRQRQEAGDVDSVGVIVVVVVNSGSIALGFGLVVSMRSGGEWRVEDSKYGESMSCGSAFQKKPTLRWYGKL